MKIAWCLLLVIGNGYLAIHPPYSDPRWGVMNVIGLAFSAFYLGGAMGERDAKAKRADL